MELKIVETLDPQIHPTAVIDPTAIVHKNVIIGPGAVIGPNCEIGEGTIIGPHVVIAKNVRMGRNNHIYSGAVIGEEPQDLKFRGENSFVDMGKRPHPLCGRRQSHPGVRHHSPRHRRKL